MKPAKLLHRVRRAARGIGAQLVESPERGKGSHRLYVLYDKDGHELATFLLTGHQREVSWTVLRSIESRLAPLFGDKWMEER